MSVIICKKKQRFQIQWVLTGLLRLVMFDLTAGFNFSLINDLPVLDLVSSSFINMGDPLLRRRVVG